MSDAPEKVYAGAIGFIQFDPKERDANGQTVRDIVIRAFGSQQKIGITLWPQWDAYPVKKGDLIAVEGQYRKSTKTYTDDETGETRTVTYHNLGANKLVVNPSLVPAEREVVNATAASDDAADDDIPF